MLMLWHGLKDSSLGHGITRKTGKEKNRWRKMTWNYRVIKQERPEGTTTYAIYEVYYDEQDNIQFITKGPVNPHGETIEEIRGDLEYMFQALDKPILNMEELDELFTENSENIRNNLGRDAST